MEYYYLTTIQRDQVLSALDEYESVLMKTNDLVIPIYVVGGYILPINILNGVIENIFEQLDFNIDLLKKNKSEITFNITLI